ncbi:hypothetical protein SynA1524_00099 [Synechococcus sp. A15-24]|nr:hypothetical protein SynA1524_00099 [Synechococcus sp. A15-24]
MSNRSSINLVSSSIYIFDQLIDNATTIPELNLYDIVYHCPLERFVGTLDQLIELLHSCRAYDRLALDSPLNDDQL